jgi:hypothetical protein
MLNALFGEAGGDGTGGGNYTGGKHRRDLRGATDNNAPLLNQYTLNLNSKTLEDSYGLSEAKQTYYHHFRNPATIMQYTADAQGRAKTKYDVLGRNNWESWLDTEAADYLTAVSDANVDIVLKNESLTGTAPNPYRITTTSRNYLMANDLANYYIGEDGVMVRPPGNVMAVSVPPGAGVPVAPPIP